jgi:uncharacterized protein YbjT (DUF2867 family)
MTTGVVAVFGGTGFLGRRIVRHLRNRGYSVRTASRHPERGQRLFGTDDPHIQSVEANVCDEQSVAAAIAGVDAVVNAVSHYVEHGAKTFHSVHVEAAQRVAVQAHRAGIEHLVHLSGIGADSRSRSLYIRKRGEGELAVLAAFPNAIVIRPAVMFAPDDAFLNTILRLLQRLPIYPMFGSGLTRLQPVYVEDVAEAVVRTLQRTETKPITFELGGPHVYTYREFLRVIAHAAELKPILIPVPFTAWQALSWLAEGMPNPPITRNQVELMHVDTVASPEMLGFGELEISPCAVEEALQEIMRAL